MPSSQAASVIFWAARPRSHMIEYGASLVAGSGTTRAMAAAAPATCWAYGPTSDSCVRCARSVHATKSQRCEFLELPARRPASRIRCRCSGSSGRSSNLRMARVVSIACHVSMFESPQWFCGRGGGGRRRRTARSVESGRSFAWQRLACSRAEAVDRIRRTLHDASRGAFAGRSSCDRPTEPSGEEGCGLAAAAGVLVQPAVAEIGEDERVYRRVVLAAATLHCSPGDEFQVRDRNAVVLRAVDKEQRTAIADGGGLGAGVLHRVASCDKQDRRGEPGQRNGDQLGDLHPSHLERLASHPHQICRGGGADDGLDQWLMRGGHDWG